MATKKTKDDKDDKDDKRTETLDERDRRDDRDPRDTRTARERREDAEERAEEAARAYDESEPGEVIDRSRLPLNHPTIIGPDDTQPPPEATPREGKTSGQAPATEPAPSGAGPKEETRRDVLVEATGMGYYDLIRRRPGDIFAINKKDFSERWMKKPAEGVPVTPVRLSNQVIAENFRNVRAGGRGVSGGLDQAEEPNPFRDQ